MRFRTFALNAVAQIIALAASVFALASCGASRPETVGACEAGVVRDRADTVTVCGNITPDLADRVVEALRSPVSKVIMTSGGGSTSDAIRIVRAVNAAKSTLVVRGYCASACASFVFAGADRVFIEKNSIVIFHHTTSAVNTLAKRANLNMLNSAADAISAREVEFYEQRDIPLAFLSYPLSRIEPSCAGADKSEGVIQAYVKTRYMFYTPKREEVEGLLGHKVAGYWPKSAKEVGGIFEHHFKRPVSIVYGLNGPAPGATQSVPLCE